MVGPLHRRIWRRIRWTFNKKPRTFTLPNGLSITAPKGGAEALIYYNGYSEPEIAALLTRFLKTGMTFWDIGAHLGEYALIASPLVAATGTVEAFEPQPAIFDFLRANVQRNNLTNVAVHDVAIADHTGTRTMDLPVEPSIAALRINSSGLPSVDVTIAPLDAILEITEKIPSLIKVDVEGAELLVLDGASNLLDLPPEQAPIWIVEYEPTNCKTFGYDPSALVEKFREHGHFTYWLTPKAQTELILDSAPPPGVRSIVATKGVRP